MSLEQNIADLVTVGRRLTDEVAGKMKSIDDRVAEALRVAPEMVRVYVLDAVAGDDKAAGTSAAPLKTLAEAVKRTPMGGFLDVRLRKEQVHEVSAQLEIIGRIVFIRREGLSDVAFTGTPAPDAPVLRVLASPELHRSTVMLFESMLLIGEYQVGVAVEIVGAPGSSVAAVALGGLFGSVSRGKNTVLLRNATLKINVGTAFAACDLHILATSITREPGALLYRVTDTGVMSARTVTLPAGDTLPAMISGVVKNAAGGLANLVINHNGAGF